MGLREVRDPAIPVGPVVAIPVSRGVPARRGVGTRGVAIPVVAIRDSLAGLGGRDPGPGSRRLVRWRSSGGI